MFNEGFSGCASSDEPRGESIDLSSVGQTEYIDENSKRNRQGVERKTKFIWRFASRFLHQRELQPELMDQPDLDAAEHHDALIGLHRVNFVSGVASMMWSRLSRLAKTFPADRPMRVLDLACGGGDVAIQLATWAQAAGVNMEIEACDFSSRAIRYAQSRAEERKLCGIRFFRLDVLREPLPDEFDVLICSLFLHHLTDDEVEMLLRKMVSAARRAVLVDDLLRSWLGFIFCWIGSRILCRSRIVHLDGLQSVRAAFTLKEARSLARSAGLTGARLQRRWPERFFLTWNIE